MITDGGGNPDSGCSMTNFSGSLPSTMIAISPKTPFLMIFRDLFFVKIQKSLAPFFLRWTKYFKLQLQCRVDDFLLYSEILIELVTSGQPDDLCRRSCVLMFFFSRLPNVLYELIGWRVSDKTWKATRNRECVQQRSRFDTRGTQISYTSARAHQCAMTLESYCTLYSNTCERSDFSLYALRSFLTEAREPISSISKRMVWQNGRSIRKHVKCTLENLLIRKLNDMLRSISLYQDSA